MTPTGDNRAKERRSLSYKLSPFGKGDFKSLSFSLLAKGEVFTGLFQQSQSYGGGIKGGGLFD